MLANPKSGPRVPEKCMADKCRYATQEINVAQVYHQLSAVGHYPTLATLLTMDDDPADAMKEVEQFYSGLKAKIIRSVGPTTVSDVPTTYTTKSPEVPKAKRTVKKKRAKSEPVKQADDDLPLSKISRGQG